MYLQWELYNIVRSVKLYTQEQLKTFFEFSTICPHVHIFECVKTVERLGQ